MNLRRDPTIAILLLVLTLSMLAVLWAARKDRQHGALRDKALNECLDAGYPRMREYPTHRFFCVRSVNGTDEMREVKP